MDRRNENFIKKNKRTEASIYNFWHVILNKYQQRSYKPSWQVPFGMSN